MRATYITYMARDVVALTQFYVDGLGLTEVEESRGPFYREVLAGGCKIGFAHESARATLNMAEQADPTGIRSLLTFDVETADAVAPAVGRAVAHGGQLVREALDTPFGQHQAVLRDPEGNAFRISAPVAS